MSESKFREAAECLTEHTLSPTNITCGLCEPSIFVNRSDLRSVGSQGGGTLRLFARIPTFG
jgi:hypothetical protein